MVLSDNSHVTVINNRWFQHGCFRVYSHIGRYEVYFNEENKPPIFDLYERSSVASGFEAVCKATPEYYKTVYGDVLAECAGFKNLKCGTGNPCRLRTSFQFDGMPISAGSIAHDLCCDAYTDGYGCQGKSSVDGYGDGNDNRCKSEWTSAQASAKMAMPVWQNNRIVSGEWCRKRPESTRTVDISDKLEEGRPMRFDNYTYYWQQGNFPFGWDEMCAQTFQKFHAGGQEKYAADYCCSREYDANRGCVQANGDFCRNDGQCKPTSRCRENVCRKWPFNLGETCKYDIDCIDDTPCCEGKCNHKVNKCRVDIFGKKCLFPYRGCPTT
mmetsp:Transcript_26555/g.61144  ORF Transcript_26555/g.61144 Transcript_26555/m.61144 type:complete len:326 (-) Transcript_26555:15-992(-)